MWLDPTYIITHSVSAVRLDSWYDACGRAYRLDKEYWALGTAKNNVY